MNPSPLSEILVDMPASRAKPWRFFTSATSRSRLPELIKHLVMLVCWLSPIAGFAQAVDLVHLGQWPGYIRGYGRGVAIAGDHAYVASADLHVLDIRQPTNPKLLTVAPVNGAIYGVAVSGHLASAITQRYDGNKYVSDLLVLDVSEPTAPRLMGQNQDDNTRWFHALAMGGGYVYVGDQGRYDGQTGTMIGGRLRIFDISDPANPIEVGGLFINGIEDITIAGDYAYLAAGTGLQVIDISAPSSPRRVGSANYDFSNIYNGVAVAGQVVFLAGYEGLRVLDVSNPSVPVQLGFLSHSNFNSEYSVAVSGGYAFVEGSDHLRVIDVSDPTNPMLVADVEGINGGGGSRMAVAGEYIFMTGPDLSILDISSPHTPRLISKHELSGEAENVAVSGAHAYLADGVRGLQVIDISEPTKPQRAGNYRPVGQRRSVGVLDVFVSGDLAYLAVSEDTSDGTNHRLEVVDIRDPENLYLLGQAHAVSTPQAVRVSNGIAYLATGSTGLTTFDVSDPANPRWLGQYDWQAYALDVAVAGRFAFIAFDSDQTSMDVLDVSDPSNPSLVGSIAIGSAWNVAVLGEYAYLEGGSGLQVVDVSNPASPRLVGSFPQAQVFISGDRALAVGGGQIQDVSDPANPRELGAYNIGVGYGRGKAVAGDLLFLAGFTYALQILRVDAAAPAPQLLSMVMGDSLNLRWHSTSTGFVLESSPDPTATT